MTKLNISVIGKNGQLARALAARNKTMRHNIKCYGREALDLTSDHAQVFKFIDSLSNTDVVINAAAYTAVDTAEDDYLTAFKVNAEAPELIAKVCVDRDIPFVHISTDYVFNGQNAEPYKIDNLTNPLSVYGASKLAGEKAILSHGGSASILRTSWVYDGTGKNFFTTMLRLGQERKEMNVVSDQYGRPTYAGHLADAALRTAEVLCSGESAARGIFHVTGAGTIINWAQFAQAIFAASRAYRLYDINVNEIASADYPTRAKRPAYSVLDISRFEEIFQMKLPEWREGLKDAMAEWIDHKSAEA